MTETTSAPGPIAIVVAHGVGAQQPGASMGKLLAGLERVRRDSESHDHRGVFTIGDQPVRVYEVHWADLLTGENAAGTFQMSEFQSLSWFPCFNFFRGCYPKGSYSMWRLWWCTSLPLLGFWVLIGYYGAGLISQLFRGGRVRPATSRDSTIWQRARDAARRTSRFRRIDGMLDEYLGDVISYVNSAGDAFYRDEGQPPVPPAVKGAYAKVVQRCYDQLLKAQADGCASIQIVAHSLGTVVTHHALSGLRFETEGREDAEAIKTAIAKVRHVYTIGSPLEKIRFFWPRLTMSTPPSGGMKVRWDNFVSWFDPVAGTLKNFGDWGEVSNHRLLGGGFFRGHVVYEHSPVFLDALTRGLCGRSLPVERTLKERATDMLLLLGETLLAPAALLIVLLLGVVVFSLTAQLLPYLMSLVLRVFLPEQMWVPIVEFSSMIALTAISLTLVLAPALRAWKVHSLYWAAAPSGRAPEREARSC